MKIRNTTKNRKATPNEIAKAIIKDKLKLCYFFSGEMSKSLKNLEIEENEVLIHLDKQIQAIEKKLNLSDRIKLW